jgi:hypothetical protein
MSLQSITIIDIHRHIAHPGFMTNLASFPRDMFLEEIPDQTKTQKDTKPFQPSVRGARRRRDCAGRGRISVACKRFGYLLVSTMGLARLFTYQRAYSTPNNSPIHKNCGTGSLQ